MFPFVCSNGSTRTVPLLAPVGAQRPLSPCRAPFYPLSPGGPGSLAGPRLFWWLPPRGTVIRLGINESSICSSSFRSSRSPGATTRATAVLGLIDAYTSATVLCCPTCGASLPGDRSAHHPGSGCLRAVQSAGVTSPVAVFVAGSSPLGALP